MSNQQVTIPNPLNAGDTLSITVGTPPPPTITSVTVAGPTILTEGATAQFSANVQGTGNFNPAVTWKCSDGTISQTGLFTAPNKVESVTVTATSVQDSTKAGSQPVSISAPSNTVIITPNGTDDTANVQNNLNSTASKGQILKLALGTWKLRPINIPSSARMVATPQASIQDLPGYGATDCMFTANGSQGFSLDFTGAFLSMPNSFAQSMKDGNEWRHCIALRGNCKNFQIIAPNISQAGGDGINFDSCSSGVVTDPVTIGCFRQGYSVTGTCDSITCNNVTASRNLHTGWDFEPNSATDKVTNFIINKFSSDHNAGGGMSCGFGNMGPQGQVGVTVNNATSDTDDQYGFFFTNSNKGGNNEAPGFCTFNNPVAKNSGYASFYGSKANGGWQMVVNNLIGQNSNRNGVDRFGMNSQIGVRISGGEPGQVGGVNYNNVVLTGGNGAMSMSGAVNSTVSGTWNGSAIKYP